MGGSDADQRRTIKNQVNPPNPPQCKSAKIGKKSVFQQFKAN